MIIDKTHGEAVSSKEARGMVNVAERAVPTRNEDWMEIYKNLAERIKTVYGEKLKSVILYGSAARGTATEESDIDILAVVDETQEELKKYEDRLCDVSMDFDLKYFKVFSVINVSAGVYEEWKHILPFYINIEKEGVVLYAA